MSVDCQKKNKAPRWKPKSRPYNGDTIIAKSSGSNIKLACPAYGYPKPTTTWYKNDVLFDANQRPKTKSRYNSLILNDVQEADKGKYKCVVQNTEGSINFTFIVDVIRTSWPLVIEEPKNATVMEGEKVVLRCRALNDPDATTQWIKRSGDSGSTRGATANENFMQSNGPELVIESAKVEDTGKYVCMVGNYIGIKSVDVWVMVKQATTSTTTTTTTEPPTTTTTSTTTTTPAPTTTTTSTVASTSTPQPTTTTSTELTYVGPLIIDTTDDEDVYEGGSGNDVEKKKKNKKKKKKKNKNKKNRKKNRKKKKERQQERERKQQQREKKRQEELDQMNKETSHKVNVNFPDVNYPHINNPTNQDHFENIFPNHYSTPAPTEDEDDNEFFPNGNININGGLGNSENPYIKDRLPTKNDPFSEFPEGQQQEEEGMSAWTIYIIVGLVAGGVLLVGLVAIVVALCCNRIEDRNGYKHTSV